MAQRYPEADFSHSICPECMVKLYPGYAKKTDHRQSWQVGECWKCDSVLGRQGEIVRPDYEASCDF